MMSKEELNRRLHQAKIVGNTATIACLIMYTSYIQQIISNFTGHPVSPLQPICASINALLWVAYGWIKPKKDWPVIIVNFPGIIFGILTFVTAYLH